VVPSLTFFALPDSQLSSSETLPPLQTNVPIRNRAPLFLFEARQKRKNRVEEFSCSNPETSSQESQKGEKEKNFFHGDFRSLKDLILIEYVVKKKFGAMQASGEQHSLSFNHQ
jgi:hypothetical protein